MGLLECVALTKPNCLCLLTVADEINLTPRSERMAGKQQGEHLGTHREPGHCPGFVPMGTGQMGVSTRDFFIKEIVYVLPKVSVMKTALRHLSWHL